MAKKRKLFDDDVDDCSENDFVINEEYANKYDKWREAEELQTLKTKNLSDSDSESSDEDAKYSSGLAKNPKYMKDYLLTLGAISSKDKKLLEKKFYKDEYEVEMEEEEEKPLTIRDYQIRNLLEKDGEMSDADESSDENMGYLVKGGGSEDMSCKVEFNDEMSDNEEMFVKRKPEKNEMPNSEYNDADEAINYIRGKINTMKSKDEEAALKSLREEYKNPNLDEKEKWLLDFFLDRNELIKQSEDLDDDCIIDEEAPSDDEKTLQKIEEFEMLDRFKHEKDNEKLIKSFPRLVVDSVRIKDKKRSMKRKEIKERKQKEREERKLEGKKLKALAKKKLSNEIMRIKHTAGLDDIPINENDLEEAFDPEKHDEAMKRIFSSNYYKDDNNEEKPVFSDDSELDTLEDDYDNWIPTEREEANSTETGVNNSISTEAGVNSSIELSKPGPSTAMSSNNILPSFRKKKRKKSKFSEMLEKPKPLYQLYAGSFSSYIENYYGLDNPDVIPGTTIPFRYKYRKVGKNNFGLTTSEILKATDTDLNKWISWKKISKYDRDEKLEKRDYVRFKIKSQNEEKKRKIMPSLYEDTGEMLLTEEDKKRKKYEKKKLRKQRRLLEMKKEKKRNKDKKKCQDSLSTQESNSNS